MPITSIYLDSTQRPFETMPTAEPVCDSSAASSLWTCPSAYALTNPAPALGGRWLPSLLFTQGCGPPKIEDQLTADWCASEPITVEGKVSEEHFAMMTEFVAEDLSLLAALVPDWVCDLRSVEMEYSNGNWNHSKAGSYYPGDDRIKLYFSKELLEFMANAQPGTEDYEYYRMHIRYVIFHEVGHFVSDTHVDEDFLNEFGSFSWERDQECQRNSQADELRDCWKLKDAAIAGDFLANTLTTGDEGNAYGAGTLAEDWATAFQIAAMNLVVAQVGDFDGTLFYTEEDYYSDEAQAKLDWMTNFIVFAGENSVD